MRFRDYMETVKGIRDVLGGGQQVVFLGQFGWFDAYAYTMHPNIEDYNQKVYHVDDMHLHPKPAYDEMLYEENRNKVRISLTEASEGLTQLGFRKMRATVLYTSEGNPNHGATHDSERHIIRINKALSLVNATKERAIHVVAHEWAHSFWKQLPKETKGSYELLYLKQLATGFEGSPSEYAMTKPGELFSEIVATAVSNPKKLSSYYWKMLHKMAAGQNAGVSFG